MPLLFQNGLSPEDGELLEKMIQEEKVLRQEYMDDSRRIYDELLEIERKRDERFKPNG